MRGWEDSRVQLPDWRLPESDHGRGRIRWNSVGAFPRQRVRLTLLTGSLPWSFLKLCFFCLLLLSILVNSRSRINRFQFAKVFWDYGAAGGPSETVEKPAGSLGNVTDHHDELATPFQKMDEKNEKESDKPKLFSQNCVLLSCAKQPVQGKDAVAVVRWC